MYQLNPDLFEDQVTAEELTCCFCICVYLDPVVDKCSGHPHTFCRQCIQRHLDSTPRCPISKCSLRKSDLIPDQAALQKLSSLRMRCPFCTEGCPTIEGHSQVVTHIPSCPFRWGTAATNTVDFPTSGGNRFEWNMESLGVDLRSVRVERILLEFTKEFVEGQALPSISGLQLGFSYLDFSGEKKIEFSSFQGRPHYSKPATWTNQSHVVDFSDRTLLGLDFHLGSRFYPALTVRTAEHPPKTYGYPELTKAVIPVDIPPRAQIIGFFGKSGWVIDSVGFNIIIPRASQPTLSTA